MGYLYSATFGNSSLSGHDRQIANAVMIVAERAITRKTITARFEDYRCRIGHELRKSITKYINLRIPLQLTCGQQRYR